MTRVGVRRVFFYIAAALIALVLGVAGFAYHKVRSNFNAAVLQQQEDILRDDLAQMRAAIHRYTADHGSPPQSLNDLVKARHLPEIPQDPVTRKQEWQVVRSSSDSNRSGIVDVHSWSTQKSSTGRSYNEW